MSAKRIHLANKQGNSLCGVRSGNPLLSNERGAITCRNCLAASTPLSSYDGQFFSKIAGVTFDNPDGSSRQAIIERCQIGERLVLKPEPENPYDPKAVRVLRENGEQLGHLGARQAADLQRYLLEGQIIPCCISDLTGGGEYARGVNIHISARQSSEQGGEGAMCCVVSTPKAQPAWGLLLIFVLGLVLVGIVLVKLQG